eukprot:Trichotokara_eunicae@DN529_c0_g1_i2.p1
MKLTTASFTLACLALAQPSVPVTLPLNIIHFNDAHARIEMASGFGGPCGADPTACFGGVAKQATVLKALKAEAREEGRFPLAIDAGDQFMGTVWNAFYKGTEIKQFHNMMDIDLFVLGNHEFDYGGQILHDNLLNGLKAPVAACNIDFSANDPLKDLEIPHFQMKTFVLNEGDQDSEYTASVSSRR